MIKLMMVDEKKALKRNVFERGRLRKFLVVVDESPESEAALSFAATRVRRTGGAITMLFVIHPGQYQQWLGVKEMARREAAQKAKAVFRLYHRKLHKWGITDLQIFEVIKEGQTSDAVRGLIEEDEDIAILVLGASTDQAGPGPMITQLMSGAMAGHFPVPISIIPGNLSPEEIEAMA